MELDIDILIIKPTIIHIGGGMLCDDEHMMLMQSSLQIQKKKCKLDRAILINSVYFNLYLLNTIFKDFSRNSCSIIKR